MYIIYIIYYTYSNKELVKVVSSNYSRNYKGYNIRYNKSLDSNSIGNCPIYIHCISPIGSHSTTSNSSVSNYSLEDP